MNISMKQKQTHKHRTDLELPSRREGEGGMDCKFEINNPNY